MVNFPACPTEMQLHSTTNILHTATISILPDIIHCILISGSAEQQNSITPSSSIFYQEILCCCYIESKSTKRIHSYQGKLGISIKVSYFPSTSERGWPNKEYFCVNSMIIEKAVLHKRPRASIPYPSTMDEL